MSNTESTQAPGAESQAQGAEALLRRIVEAYDTMHAWRLRHETENPEPGAEVKETQFRLVLAMLMDRARSELATPAATQAAVPKPAEPVEPEWRQVMRAVAEQFDLHANNFPDGFDSRVFRWVKDLMAGVHDPVNGADKEYNIEGDRELELLLNLSVDMAAGRGSHDTAMWWSDTLDNVLKRLAYIPNIEAHKLTVAHEPNRGGWSVGAVAGGDFKWLAYGDEVGPVIGAAVDVLGSPAPAAAEPVLVGPSAAAMSRLTKWIEANKDIFHGLEGTVDELAIQVLREYQFLHTNWLAIDYPKVWDALNCRSSSGLSKAIRAAIAGPAQSSPAAH